MGATSVEESLKKRRERKRRIGGGRSGPSLEQIRKMLKGLADKAAAEGGASDVGRF
ncbi:hypothetical protein [Actinomadura gamaensis]|uniref:Uncharacterized protein n=1 Tax=Actinomadura gamaensis TaxID=1763541 RepID=A0ABV9UAP2_9ACTN